MKTTATLLTASLVSAMTLSASASLVGQYEFDDTGDLGKATVGTDGVALSGGIGTAAAGQAGFGGAIDVSGSLTGVDLGTQYDSVFNTGVFTVTFWIKSAAAGTDAPILSWASWDNADGGNRQGVTIATQGSGNLNLQGVIGDGTNRVDAGDPSGVAIGDDAWTLVALSVDQPNDTATIYALGAGSGSATVDLSAFGATLGSRAASTFVIGEHGPAGAPTNDPYNGTVSNAGISLIDDVRIYDNALTQGEIQALVPEPTSLALLALGGMLVARRRRG